VTNGFGNSVSVLDAGAGTVVRIVPVGQAPGQVVVDRCAHRAYVLNLEASDGANHGSVSVLDTTSGGVLATVPVGSGPLHIAVDVRTSRAFVANNDSNSVSVLATSPGNKGAACA
jgi:YVTN family beta-propeller protein